MMRNKFILSILIIALISVVQISAITEDAAAGSRAVTGAAAAPGSAGASLATSTATPVPLKVSCLTQKCKEIDQVWEKIRPYLLLPELQGRSVWDPETGQWIPLITPPVIVGGAKVPTRLPTGDIADRQVTNDLAQGLYNREFLQKLDSVSKALNVNPVFILAVMRAETGAKFSPGRYANGAVGLIQFTDVAAQAVGKTKDQLAVMDQITQLDSVQKYFENVNKGKQKISNTFNDVAMAVFAPAYVGKNDDTVLYTQISDKDKYTNNMRLDSDPKNDQITRKEYVAFAMERGGKFYDLTQTTFFQSTRLNFLSGVEKQMSDASNELKALIDCIHGYLPAGVGQISSISDRNSLATCRDMWSDSQCAHTRGSSHYGCNTNNELSLGVDYGDERNTCEIVAAAINCGVTKPHIIGPTNSIYAQQCGIQYTQDNLRGHENHVHVSVPKVNNKESCK